VVATVDFLFRDIRNKCKSKFNFAKFRKISNEKVHSIGCRQQLGWSRQSIFYFGINEISAKVNLISQNFAKFRRNFVTKISLNFWDIRSFTFAKFRQNFVTKISRNIVKILFFHFCEISLKFCHQNFAKSRRNFVHSLSRNFVELFSSKILSIGAKFIFSKTLKGQSHEKVYEFFTWDGSFSLN
jgi:hypothetical protein